jgi:hypothetical protein
MIMKKTLWIAALALFLSPFSSPAQEPAPQPVWKEGDAWQFNIKERDFGSKMSNPLDGIYECVFSEGTIKMFSVRGDAKQPLSPRPAPLFVMFNLLKEQPQLKFPLTVGEKWNYRYTIRIPGMEKDLNRSVEIVVAGIEEVTTPAGKFRAFKLTKDDRSSGRDFWVTTYYYSPETKSVVRSFLDMSGAGTAGKRDIELVKFTSGS